MHAAQIILSTHFTNSGTYKATINNSRTKFLTTEKKLIKKKERLQGGRPMVQEEI